MEGGDRPLDQNWFELDAGRRANSKKVRSRPSVPFPWRAYPKDQEICRRADETSLGLPGPSQYEFPCLPTGNLDWRMLTPNLGLLQTHTCRPQALPCREAGF